MIVVLGIVLSLIALGLVGWMLLTRRIQEKYAVLWILIALCVLILGLFPQLLLWATALIGVQLPANLLFALAILLLLGVTLHLSWELSRAEDEIRRLAEESAIARARLDQLHDRMDALDERTAGEE
ncbi:DUF2304 domain-containing protein [Microbacterium sp. p3-SID338]|uniref:DUF2304 domain-containing protein n=1 Tax=unclassified Microbacterium TaxID=2609290 RepID=UPI0007884DBF|nr:MULTISPECIES: DUF2304 domain-containing protein [unclassified Microbacterium]KYJ99904.1 hypothetical protein AUV07_06930 [Microbacterium sp. CH1]MCT1395307.1 DUF2304 domain-containing protein [Microbacterium sp. p3-SID338]PMC06954.1 DUF2304 domain-containing protein [Microbacterium sp. UMB0228]